MATEEEEEGHAWSTGARWIAGSGPRRSIRLAGTHGLAAWCREPSVATPMRAPSAARTSWPICSGMASLTIPRASRI
eukprot:2744750-Pyramimonas_sp.AAC.1